MDQPSAGASRSRRERLYPASPRPAKPMPSIAQVEGSGTATNSKSLEPVVNTTLQTYIKLTVNRLGLPRAPSDAGLPPQARGSSLRGAAQLRNLAVVPKVSLVARL
jgi:hypothetical protein